jgi:hypothetical protein
MRLSLYPGGRATTDRSEDPRMSILRSRDTRGENRQILDCPSPEGRNEIVGLKFGEIRRDAGSKIERPFDLW